MATCPSNNSNPAHRHDNPALHADTATAIAAGIVYKGIWFSIAGSIDVVDLSGNKKTVTGGVGSVYPCENFGIVTGGGTTLSTTGFLYLF